MRYDGKNLKAVLEAHKRWINLSEGWSEKDRADLSETYLTEADLREVDLRGADLRGADMVGVYLMGANLRSANMRGANLSYANMMEADLRGACLIDAILSRADLSRADMKGADIRCAVMSEANIFGAKNVPFIPMICPDTGAFIGWKKCVTHGQNNNDVIVKLLIPENAKRSSSTSRICRSDRAVVLEIQNIDGSKADFDTAYSTFHRSKNFAYTVGETVVPEKPFEKNRWEECASGIHFFINRQEAVDY